MVCTRTTLSSCSASTSSRRAKFCWRRSLNSSRRSSCTLPKAALDLRRLEVVAGVLEQEDHVVGRAVGQRAEAIASGIGGTLFAPEQVALGMTTPASPHQRLVEPLRVVDGEHAALARGGDRVTTREARHRDVGSSSRARAAQVRVEHVAAVFHDEQAVAIGDGADGIPVGAVADEVGRQDRLRARTDHRFDGVDVDLQCLGIDVDERGDDAVAHERGDVAREGQWRRDHLVAGLAAEEVDREPQRRGSAVDHHRVLLGEELGAAPFELRDFGTDGKTAGCLEHAHDGVDLALVVHRPGFGDGGVSRSLDVAAHASAPNRAASISASSCFLILPESRNGSSAFVQTQRCFGTL